MLAPAAAAGGGIRASLCVTECNSALLAATGAAGAEAADKLAQEKRLLCVKGHELEVGQDILLLG